MTPDDRPDDNAPDHMAEDPAGLGFGPEGVEVLGSEVRHRGFFTVREVRLRHRLFRGGWSRPFTRELFDRGHAVAVLLYDPDRDAVVLVEQFRIGTVNTAGPHWLLEVVAGIVDTDETPEAVAIREAKEEAGRDVTALEWICDYYPSPGGCSETIGLYCGRVDSAGAGGVHGLADENEDIRVRVLPADAAIAMLDRGALDNAAIIIALHWLARNRDRLRAAWRGAA